MTRVGRHDKMLKTTFQKDIIYDMHNTTLWHRYDTHTHTHHIMHHNRYSESSRSTRF